MRASAAPDGRRGRNGRGQSQQTRHFRGSKSAQSAHRDGGVPCSERFKGNEVAVSKGDLLAKFNQSAPAEDAAISTFEEGASARLSDDYKQFLGRANGGEGFVGETYVILWPVERLRELNSAYQVEEYAPGLLLFGSDGGGEAFAFDMRSPAKPIVYVPFVGMEQDLARPIAPNFTEFLQDLRRRGRAEMSMRSDERQVRPREAAGKEIFEIKPVKLGGSPTDPSNKIVLTRHSTSTLCATGIR